MAQCFRKLQRRREALDAYQLYLTEWKRQKPKKVAPFQDEVDGYISELTAGIAADKLRADKERKRKKRRPGRLLLRGVPAGATVYVDGTARGVGPVSAPLKVAPGRHTLRVESDDHETWSSSVSVKRGRKRRIVVQMVAARSSVPLILGITAAVLAAGAEALAIVFTLKANDAFSDSDDFTTFRTVAIAGHVGAGVLAAGSIASFVVYAMSGAEKAARPGTSAAEPRARALLVPVPGGGIVGAHFRF